MADKTPAEIIAQHWPSLRSVYGEDMGRKIIVTLEEAGYRIVAAVEPADELISAAAQSLCFSRNGDIEQWINYRGDALDAILDALAAAPTWGGKDG